MSGPARHIALFIRSLGADGVWVGTRLVATREAAVHYEHKRRLVEGTGEQTVRSSIFGPAWPHFNPMRLAQPGGR